jgi:hypothetical protein
MASNATGMPNAHQIIRTFMTDNAIDEDDLLEWLRDARYPEDELNIHDSRYLAHLQDYVEERAERDSESVAGPSGN